MDSTTKSFAPRLNPDSLHNGCCKKTTCMIHISVESSTVLARKGLENLQFSEQVARKQGRGPSPLASAMVLDNNSSLTENSSCGCGIFMMIHDVL